MTLKRHAHFRMETVFLYRAITMTYSFGNTIVPHAAAQTMLPLSEVAASADARPLQHVSNKELARLLLDNNRAFLGGGSLSKRLIEDAADNRSALNGSYSDEQKNIARELVARPELLKTLGTGLTHRLMNTNEVKRSDLIEVSDLALEADRADLMSDNSLIQHTYLYFNEYAAGGSADRYVNFNELRQAAGLVPSDRTFSPKAKSVAAELLKRTSLLNDLDVGVGLWGVSGSKDERFDKENLTYMNGKTSRRARFP